MIRVFLLAHSGVISCNKVKQRLCERSPPLGLSLMRMVCKQTFWSVLAPCSHDSAGDAQPLPTCYEIKPRDLISSAPDLPRNQPKKAQCVGKRTLQCLFSRCSCSNSGHLSQPSTVHHNDEIHLVSIPLAIFSHVFFFSFSKCDSV